MPDAPKPQAALGSAIRQLRERAKLTQEELADRAGVSTPWISKIESGRRSPGWGTLQLIAAGLDVRMLELTALAERIELE